MSSSCVSSSLPPPCHDVHLALALQRSILQRRHAVSFLFRLSLRRLGLLGAVLLAPRFKVARRPSLDDVVAVFWIRLHDELGAASRASEVKAEDHDAEVILPDDVLLAGVELGSLDDVVAARVATHRHGKHHPHLHLPLGQLVGLRDFRGIKVGGDVLVENLALTHGCRFLLC